MSMMPATIQLETSLLNAKARAHFDFWRGIIEPLLAMPERGIMATIAELRIPGVAAKTIYNKYRAAKLRGLIALVDRKLAGSGWWKATKGQAALSKEDIELVKIYAEKNQRSTKSAMKELCRDWRAGKVKTTTPIHAVTRMPRGWSLRNLSRHAPTTFELKSVRIGRTAAASERPLVYTTRKGLWVGSHYMFDDMWHDFFVNTFAENQAGRPLELFSHDLYSACKMRWGVRVRTRKDDGTYNQLTEKMTRMILAATLSLDGYSPRGTKLVVEHGTAAIRGKTKQEQETQAIFRQGLDKILYELSDGKITVHRSGMTGAAAHSGQYRGVSKGNFRHKASLESSNNLVHNFFASLPGQTGKDVEHRPEQLDGMLRHNAGLLAARAMLPAEQGANLRFALLELAQFTDKAKELYEAIEHDTEHELSDWAECGHVRQQVLMGEHWVNIDQVAANDEQADLVMRMIESGALKTRPRRMSRGEVKRAGAAELVRLAGHGVVAILGDDLAVERTIRANRFEFEDAEVGPGVHRFESVCMTPFGERLRLRDGETYETFVNPFAADVMLVRRADGSYLGECRRDDAISRADIDAEEQLRRKQGQVAKEEAALLTPLRLRHMAEGREKAERHEHNRNVLGHDTPEERAERRRQNANAADVTDFLAPDAGEERGEQTAVLDPSDFLAP